MILLPPATQLWICPRLADLGLVLHTCVPVVREISEEDCTDARIQHHTQPIPYMHGSGSVDKNSGRFSPAGLHLEKIAFGSSIMSLSMCWYTVYLSVLADSRLLAHTRMHSRVNK